MQQYPMSPNPSGQPPYPQPRPAQRKGRRPRGKAVRLSPLLVSGALALGGAVVMFLCMVGVLLAAILTQERIPAGVSVAGVDLGGVLVEDASGTVARALGNPNIVLRDGERTWSVPLSQLGIRADVAATLARAQAAAPNSAVQPVYVVDLVATQEGLVNLSEQTNIPAAEGQIGRALEIPVLLDRLRADTAGEIADGVIDLPMIETAPPTPEERAANYDGPTTVHVVERGQELGLIAREYGVSIEDIVLLNGIGDADLIYPGQELLIPASGEYVPPASDIPAPPTGSGRAIVVSVSQQRIYAFENGALVRTHLVSTGRAQTPTVLGDYRVYVKYTADDMSGPDYFLPQVPYTMYFYQGYAIHGTYWHNSFGRPMSHGCVNLPVDEARWFFDFASVGTPIRVVG